MDPGTLKSAEELAEVFLKVAVEGLATRDVVAVEEEHVTCRGDHGPSEWLPKDREERNLVVGGVLELGGTRVAPEVMRGEDRENRLGWFGFGLTLG